jgi:hypothetical protein
MALSQSLQGSQGRRHYQEVGIGIVYFATHASCINNGFHDEIPDASAIQIGNIPVSVVSRGLQGKKQCLLRETQRAAIRQQPPYPCISRTDATCSYERSDFLYRVIHIAKPVPYFPSSD